MFIVCDSDDIESETHGAKLILGPKRLKWVEHLLGGNSPDMPEPVCICLNSSIHHPILQEHGNIRFCFKKPIPTAAFIAGYSFRIMSPKATLSIDAFPVWARFNDVEFINAKLQETNGKGIGLVTASSLTTTPASEKATEVDISENREVQGTVIEGQEDERARREIPGQTKHNSTKLLQIPHDLVLSATAIEEYTKVDQNFRQLIDSAGHQVRLRNRSASVS